MTKKINLGEWWAGLTIAEKERIASKVVSKRVGKPVEVLYPNCTNIWNDMKEREQLRVYDHVTDDHGVVLQEYRDGKTFSY